MTVCDLAIRLNVAGHKTSYKTTYSGGRGTYRLISSTYIWLIRRGLKAEADIVAKAFTKPNGKYAYR